MSMTRPKLGRSACLFLFLIYRIYGFVEMHQRKLVIDYISHVTMLSLFFCKPCSVDYYIIFEC